MMLLLDNALIPYIHQSSKKVEYEQQWYIALEFFSR